MLRGFSKLSIKPFAHARIKVFDLVWNVTTSSPCEEVIKENAANNVEGRCYWDARTLICINLIFYFVFPWVLWCLWYLSVSPNWYFVVIFDFPLIIPDFVFFLEKRNLQRLPHLHLFPAPTVWKRCDPPEKIKRKEACFVRLLNQEVSTQKLKASPS